MLQRIAFVLSLSFASPVLAQDAADLDGLVRDRARAAAELSVAEVWSASQGLADAAGGADKLDRAIDDLLGSDAELHERAVLMLAAVRLRGGEPNVERLAPRLQALLDSSDDEVAAGAAALLADRSFHALDDKSGEALVERLAALAKDGERSPSVRLEAACALHAQGRGKEQREARNTMIDFLQSSDAALRTQGALALARIGDVETPRKELEGLAKLPDARGRLARAFLDQDDVRRLYDRRLKKAAQEAESLGKDVEIKGKNADFQLMEQVIRLVETTSLEGEKIKREELVDAALDGMLRSLDEHSSFMGPKVYKEFEQDLLAAEYGGIGAYVGEDPDDKLFTIRQPIYSGPAYKSGRIFSDDKVVRIDDWPTFDAQGSKPQDEIIKRLKGKPGTTVKLYIWRRGMDPALIDRPTEEMAVEIERAEITIPPVKAEMLPDGIAHVELTTFSRVASEALIEALRDMQKRGMKGLVLDMRQNSGGLLSEARNVANLFLPKGKLVVTTESRTHEPQKEITRYEPLIPEDLPVTCLVGRFTASASEIVSGALADYRRASVVGQRTFGKGSVQQLLPIPGARDDEYKDENGNQRFDPWEPIVKDYNQNGEFDFGPRARMTIARYLLPSGRSIHREIDDDGRIVQEGGVAPDVEVLPKRYEAWKLEEFTRILRSKKLRTYLDEHYAKDRALFLELAAGDQDDTTRYPDFEPLYASLQTTLSKGDVRFLLRREVRGRAQDDRGAAYPEGDYQEDVQLQAAIKVVLDKLGTSPEAVAAYARTFDPVESGDEKRTKDLAMNLTDAVRNDLRHALTLIDGARDGSLSPDRLKEIRSALESVLDR